MAYRHNDTLHKHKVRANRTKKAAVIVTSIVSVFVLIIAADWLMNQLSSSNTVVSRENTTSVQSANVSVYRTEYFQFQATQDWVAVAGESTDKKYVYVKNKTPLITHKLVVYLNRPAVETQSDFRATHVLPVEFNVFGNFENIGQVSDHCDNGWPDGLQRTPARIEHYGVSFVCSVDAKEYNVVVGEYNGDEELTAKLSNGSDITFTIVYSDLTAYPNPGDIYNIISSFNTL